MKSSIPRGRNAFFVCIAMAEAVLVLSVGLISAAPLDDLNNRPAGRRPNPAGTAPSRPVERSTNNYRPSTPPVRERSATPPSTRERSAMPNRTAVPRETTVRPAPRYSSQTVAAPRNVAGAAPQRTPDVPRQPDPVPVPRQVETRRDESPAVTRPAPQRRDASSAPPVMRERDNAATRQSVPPVRRDETPTPPVTRRSDSEINKGTVPIRRENPPATVAPPQSRSSKVPSQDGPAPSVRRRDQEGAANVRRNESLEKQPTVKPPASQGQPNRGTSAGDTRGAGPSKDVVRGNEGSVKTPTGATGKVPATLRDAVPKSDSRIDDVRRRLGNTAGKGPAGEGPALVSPRGDGVKLEGRGGTNLDGRKVIEGRDRTKTETPDAVGGEGRGKGKGDARDTIKREGVNRDGSVTKDDPREDGRGLKKDAVRDGVNKDAPSKDSVKKDGRDGGKHGPTEGKPGGGSPSKDDATLKGSGERGRGESGRGESGRGESGRDESGRDESGRDESGRGESGHGERDRGEGRGAKPGVPGGKDVAKPHGPKVRFPEELKGGKLDHLTASETAKKLQLAQQYRMWQHGDVARRMELQKHHGNHHDFYRGPVSPHYQRHCFQYNYWGPVFFSGVCWYPTWSTWVNWSWHYHCHPYWDPRPVWCRPVLYESCTTWVYWEVPVWRPLPVVASGTWVDLKPVVVPPETFDLELLAVRFVDPGHPEEKTGPRYRVWFRNNSSKPITESFVVLLMAGNNERPAEALPRAGVRVRSIEANDVQSVDIRLPIEVYTMNRDAKGAPAPFRMLHALVDANQQIAETTKTNNGARLAPADILPVDPAAFEVEPGLGRAGEEVLLAGEGFGPQPGRVLLHINGKEIDAEILGWYDLGVRWVLPKLDLAGPVEADVIVVRGDGAAANPLKVTIGP